MKIKGKELPCGCAERKQIIFTDGQADLTLALLVGVPLAMLLITLYIRKGT
jgi:hypothetical protein